MQNHACKCLDDLLLILRLLSFAFECTEPPVVRLDGTHNGNPLPYGDAVTLTCIPVSGIPDPILEITPSEGFQLPPGSVRRNDGGNVQLIIPRLTEAVCFDCTGTNAAGSNVDQECLDILRMSQYQ